ncbi:MAG: hypothetical protein HPY57_13135 [Ignavibacteria bacterium]|nr:hypothetical protein [Ignavibacteria bacterium]
MRITIEHTVYTPYRKITNEIDSDDLTLDDILGILEGMLRNLNYYFEGHLDIVPEEKDNEENTEDMKEILEFEVESYYCPECRAERKYLKLEEKSRWFDNYYTTFWVCSYCGNRRMIYEQLKENENGSEE